jgi:predicted ABC-type ATPase
VFSTPNKLEFLARAKARGYFVRVFFISTTDPRINAARVAGRVMDGGHTVPIEKIISRYIRSMVNSSGAIDIADRVYVYDNSIEHEMATLCARTQDGQLRKIYTAVPEWVADAIDPLERHVDPVDARAPAM